MYVVVNGVKVAVKLLLLLIDCLMLQLVRFRVAIVGFFCI